MNVTMIPIIVVTEVLIKVLEELEIRGRVETIQTTALLRSARILRRVLQSCSHLNFCGKSLANAGVKNSQRSKIIIIIIIKVRIDKTQQNSRRRLCGKRI